MTGGNHSSAQRSDRSLYRVKEDNRHDGKNDSVDARSFSEEARGMSTAMLADPASEYKEIKREAKAEFKQMKETAAQKYERNLERAREQFEREIAGVRERYHSAKFHAKEVYEKAVDDARDVYDFAVDIAKDRKKEHEKETRVYLKDQKKSGA